MAQGQMTDDHRSAMINANSQLMDIHHQFMRWQILLAQEDYLI
jgi:hypothetical protein